MKQLLLSVIEFFNFKTLANQSNEKFTYSCIGNTIVAEASEAFCDRYGY